MKKVLLIIGLVLSLSATEQASDMKEKLKLAVQLKGGNCNHVDSFVRISNTKFHINCVNKMKYSLSFRADAWELKIL